jgi:hypothetical protein
MADDSSDEYLIALVPMPSWGAGETQLANRSYLGSAGRCRHWDGILELDSK